jgi:transposase-like protein
MSLAWWTNCPRGAIGEILGEMVRGTVGETLNNLLDADAERICNAWRYERTGKRRDPRSGHHSRRLHMKAGEVKLRMP